MKHLFKGGTLVTGSGMFRADVLTDGETIAAVGRDLPPHGAAVTDVTGKLLFPGFIDAHTHFDLDVCNTTTADDFASAQKARCAAARRPSSTSPVPTRESRSATA